MPTNDTQLLEALRDIAEVAQKAVDAASGTSTVGGRTSGRVGRDLQTESIEVDVRGNIFEGVSVEHTYDDSNRRPGTLSMDVANGSGEWVAVVFECPYPYTLIWDTWRIANGSSANNAKELVYDIGKPVHIKRWRPGFLNIPGDGGGEVNIPELPTYGNVSIRFTVSG
jgi:hypothetical protein